MPSERDRLTIGIGRPGFTARTHDIEPQEAINSAHRRRAPSRSPDGASEIGPDRFRTRKLRNLSSRDREPGLNSNGTDRLTGFILDRYHLRSPEESSSSRRAFDMDRDSFARQLDEHFGRQYAGDPERLSSPRMQEQFRMNQGSHNGGAVMMSERDVEGLSLRGRPRQDLAAHGGRPGHRIDVQNDHYSEGNVSRFEMPRPSFETLPVYENRRNTPGYNLEQEVRNRLPPVRHRPGDPTTFVDEWQHGPVANQADRQAPDIEWQERFGYDQLGYHAEGSSRTIPGRQNRHVESTTEEVRALDPFGNTWPENQPPIPNLGQAHIDVVSGQTRGHGMVSGRGHGRGRSAGQLHGRDHRRGSHSGHGRSRGASPGRVHDRSHGGSRRRRRRRSFRQGNRQARGALAAPGSIAANANINHTDVAVEHDPSEDHS